MINRIEKIQKIKAKGFDIPVEKDNTLEPLYRNGSLDFSKIKVGVKTLSDAVADIGVYKKINPLLGDKKEVLEAINRGNYKRMRDISDFFYRSSGIYSRLCKYMAYMYRYDWMITPVVKDGATVADEKIKSTFYKALDYLDNFELKKFFGEVALKVIRHGCYYGYVIEVDSNSAQVQELPPDYCRVRYYIKGNPAVEFNMKFFDDMYKDAGYRSRILKLFPDEFSKGYRLFKQGKLAPDFPGDDNGWYLLDPELTFKFNLNGEDFPALITVIPAIIDLDDAQGLDRKKLQQQLLKIIIQKMPIDKNGDLIFDVDEAQALHNNAVRMLGRAVGIDVLTTFADVDVADMAESSSTTSDDTMDRIKNAVFDQGGISQMQFNTDGNIALEKSIANDAASIYNLLLNFESFINKFLLRKFNTNKKLTIRAQILTTTIYNYQELSKMYKEQMQLGYSKMLAQVALGQSQSSVLANATFENDVLDLVNVFIPPLMSSTMNGDFLTNRGGSGNGSSTDKNATAGSNTTDSSGGAGRKELPDDQKSEKTIANKESQS